jgi:hypothetical protein
VANPFLAMAAAVGWYALIRQVLRARRLDLFFPALASLVLVAFLFQYHCLDCGATGRLQRWRAHECGRVRARRAEGRSLRLPLPSPPAQTALWLSALALGAFYHYLGRL